MLGGRPAVCFAPPGSAVTPFFFFVRRVAPVPATATLARSMLSSETIALMWVALHWQAGVASFSTRTWSDAHEIDLDL